MTEEDMEARKKGQSGGNYIEKHEKTWKKKKVQWHEK